MQFLGEWKVGREILARRLKENSLIETATVDGKTVNIAELNMVLASQLNAILNVKGKKLNVPKIEPENIESSKCIKCGKNCHKRAAFCEKTFHWIHYRCDKLSAEIVHAIENDPTYKYKCQICLDREAMTVKSQTHSNHNNEEEDISIVSRISDSQLVNELVRQDETLIGQLNESRTEPKTLAESILEEEMSVNICYNCEEEIQDCESMPCEICNGTCHLSCLEDTENGMVCNACGASQNQILINGDSEED